MTGHAVYVLRCGDGSLYTGYTTDVERRLAEHRAGDGARYTRGRGPLELVHVERFESRSAAMAREYEIKQLSKPAKERLVAGGSVKP
jgi:putative endonuclease